MSTQRSGAGVGQHEAVWPLVPEIGRDKDGNIEGIYVRLRTGKATRSVQPDPDHLVFHELGKDDLLVGIHYFEPCGNEPVDPKTWLPLP